MKLQFLHSFYFTAKYNSISKAAKALHLTQPALSMQLQSLESDIGEKLLIRGNRGVELTEEGKVVLQYASSFISLEENLKKDLAAIKLKKEKLLISSCKNIGEYSLPCGIYTFKEIYPHIQVSLDIDDSITVLKKLKENDINIGIVLGDMYKNDDFIFEHLMSDKFVLVANPMEIRDSISISELTDIPLILRETDSASMKSLLKILSNYNINIDNLKVSLNMSSPQSIKSSILSGRGFAFLPNVVVGQSIRSGKLKEIKIDDFDASFDYFIVYRKDYALTDSEKKFINYMKSEKRCFCY